MGGGAGGVPLTSSYAQRRFGSKRMTRREERGSGSNVRRICNLNQWPISAKGRLLENGVKWKGRKWLEEKTRRPTEGLRCDPTECTSDWRKAS